MGVLAVHPRVCGERRGWRYFRRVHAGSSPRMRGTQTRATEVMIHDRFIPAYAGNAVRNLVEEVHQTVHPRVCGERSVEDDGLDADDGSSPRMRGTLHIILPAVDLYRFIPAYAGNAR